MVQCVKISSGEIGAQKKARVWLALNRSTAVGRYLAQIHNRTDNRDVACAQKSCVEGIASHVPAVSQSSNENTFTRTTRQIGSPLVEHRNQPKERKQCKPMDLKPHNAAVCESVKCHTTVVSETLSPQSGDTKGTFMFFWVAPPPAAAQRVSEPTNAKLR